MTETTYTGIWHVWDPDAEQCVAEGATRADAEAARERDGRDRGLVVLDYAPDGHR